MFDYFEVAKVIETGFQNDFQKIGISEINVEPDLLQTVHQSH